MSATVSIKTKSKMNPHLMLLCFTVFALLNSCVCAEIPTRLELGVIADKEQQSQLQQQQQQQQITEVHSAATTKREITPNDKIGNDSIPLEFYKELDNLTDITEFIERFVDKETVDPQLGIQGYLRRSVERANVVKPASAQCMPESTVVPLTPLEPSDDPKIGYFPQCTRVKRCSGCCSSQLMSCQPTATEVINFEVTKFRYGDRPQLLGKEIIVVEEHKKCKCNCRIKEEDCNSYQIYQPSLCRCICTNDDARQKCILKDHKIWDDQACRCICRDSQSCTTGLVFDESQCKCVDPGNGVTTPDILDRRRFIVKAVQVEPDNSTLYEF